MKKILYFLALMFCVSCATTQATTQATYMVGNIHVYDENHNEIKTYNNITIDDRIFKSHGLNFLDIESGNYVYLSNSTIYSITYIPNTVDISNRNPKYLCNAGPNELIECRSQLILQLSVYKKRFNTTDRHSAEYLVIRTNITMLRDQIRLIENILWKNHNLSPTDYS